MKRTQHERILDILRMSGDKGMNSYIWRMSFIQLPVRIMELKERGYKIVTRDNPNRSVDYILIEEPKKEEVKEVRPAPIQAEQTQMFL